MGDKRGFDILIGAAGIAIFGWQQNVNYGERNAGTF
jgi:hypothetical protein